MRYGPIPQNAREAWVLSAPNGGRASIDTLVALVQAKAIMLATRLGVFEAIGRAPQQAARLAATLGLQEQPLALLLRVLCGADYLSRSPEGYELTAIGRGNLLDSSRGRRKSHVMMTELLWSAIGDMEAGLRDGAAPDIHTRFSSEAAWNVYQKAMLEDARACAPILAAIVPVRDGATSLLDLAGAHGLYGALICRAHPPMRSVVIELPSAVEHSAALAQSEGLGDVVTHRAGNVLTENFGQDRDVILLNNILHHFSEAQARRLVRKARAAMAARGTLAIWEWQPPQEDSEPDALADATALFFRTVSAGQCYPTRQYVEWLSAAGFADISVTRPSVVPHQIAIVGRAP